MARKIARTIVALALGVGGFGAVGAAFAPSASAAPTSCSVSAYGQYGYSGICRAGTGTYAVGARCADDLRGSTSTFLGNTVKIGGTSRVTCPFQGGVQFRPVGAFIQQIS